LISGSGADGIRGQLLAVAALKQFLNDCYEPNPGAYRDFSLHLVGIGTDYVSQQIRSIGSVALGSRLAIHPPVSHAEALAVTRTCNAVICCSLDEAFGLYVAEGMAMGHVVLRNETGGFEEQLDEGVNGFTIKSDDIGQFVGVIERLLNTSKTSAAELHAMGRASQELIAPWGAHSFIGPLAQAREPAAP
jgi:glycosyltransferase involved in cell wall biosynthesis